MSLEKYSGHLNRMQSWLIEVLKHSWLWKQFIKTVQQRITYATRGRSCPDFLVLYFAERTTGSVYKMRFPKVSIPQIKAHFTYKTFRKCVETGGEIHRKTKICVGNSGIFSDCFHRCKKGKKILHFYLRLHITISICH